MILDETWRALAKRYIVYDVPDEMAACFDCDVVQCPHDRYEFCPNRLALVAALKTARTSRNPVTNPAKEADLI
jgi:hypothetical protein